MNRHAAIIILLLFSVLQATASIEIRSRQVTIADGLANNTVRCFTQDSKGFIWMGTLNGLNRYDGNSFLSYYPSHDNPLSLMGWKVYSLEEDKNGFLWIHLSSEHHSCFDLKTASFVDYTATGDMDERYSKNILFSNGDAWMWHDRNGARRTTYNNGNFTSVAYKKEKGNLPHNTVNFVFEEKGNAWLGTAKGLLLVTRDAELLVDNKENLNHAVEYDGGIYFYSNDNQIFRYDSNSQQLQQLGGLPTDEKIISDYLQLGNLWVLFTSNGIYTYDFTTQKLKASPEFLKGDVRSGEVLRDNKGNYWVYNHTGKVWYINKETAKKKQLELIPAEKMGYIDLERYRVVHDSRDVIWISTYGNGLYAYDLLKDELNHYTTGVGSGGFIGSNYLLGVMEDRSGEIWVSAEFSGISRINIINEGSFRYFPEDPTLFDRSNTVRLISRMHEDELWVATRRGGLYIYDLQLNLKRSRKDFKANVYAAIKDRKGRVWLGTRGDGISIDGVWYRNNPHDGESLNNDNIFCLFEDSKERMWVGTFNGGLALAMHTAQGYKFRHFLNKSYGQRQIRFICEDKNSMIWVGTSEGVYIFNPEELLQDSERYYHYSYNGGKLNGDEIKYLMTDSKGKVWISAAGAGFSVCEPGGDYSSLEFKHYNTKDGLCNNVVQSIVEDKEGNVWLATEYGISRYIPTLDIFENYYLSASSQGNVCIEGAAYHRENGDILLGTDHGFISFNPKAMKKQSSSFPVVFTNLHVNGTNMLPGDEGSILSKSLAYTDGIKLKSYQNSIQVDFSSFNYADANMTKYSYQLQGYDKEWSAPSSLNFAAYKQLPPGKYELLVKSGNSQGLWNSEVAKLQIVITPPFYKSGWAFLIYALLIGLVLFFTSRILRNFHRLNNKVVIEKELTEYKLVFFTNISHEFRTPLTLIQGALERINRQGTPSKEIAYPLQIMEKNTRRMLRLIDQLLEFRKMQHNKLALSLEKTDVMGMVYEVFLSFGDMAESKNIDFQFIPSSTTLKMYIDKGKLDKITYNLLSNAFKYTPRGGKICLYVTEGTERNILEIKVTDNGVGISKEKRGELFKRFMQSNFSNESVGVGLHLTLELVQVHKGEISYDENEGGGSVFTVNLPLGIDLYEEKDFLTSDSALLKDDKKEPFVTDAALALKEFKINPLNKQKILVIEDDVDVRQYLIEELGNYFFVESADNGIDGFKMAQEVEPDLIVCDVLMPGMNGYEVTRKLKAEFTTSHVPVILLTALGLPENHLEGIESGADAYLFKPFSIRLLLTRIIKILEQRERLREKFSEEPGILRTAVYTSNRDKDFVEGLHNVLEDNLSNSHFSVDEFATMMNVGRTIFYKKVKGVTGYSPNEYIRIMRMKKAAELLLTSRFTVAEVSYKVGIEDPFYFSKCFKIQFGVAPSVYMKEGEKSQ
ncbi:hybrid sensor histidine kinase/response regulator [Bacteroides sp. 214]|uniref:hybrid sensor histidine kinase/response regulator n=1 Tax=Bacteroides sp. 214 TaxID=2302935 RepID=UPI0013D6DA59|nr:two-component regulator propeller domain-containing protein [Bacteroides sp. 214]NDW11471.1 hybrid sensor histidine kinase/response regulator [Bacteroides sp. 214]